MIQFVQIMCFDVCREGTVPVLAAAQPQPHVRALRGCPLGEQTTPQDAPAQRCGPVGSVDMVGVMIIRVNSVIFKALLWALCLYVP